MCFLSIASPAPFAHHLPRLLRNVVAKDLFLLRVWSASIIPCPNAVELSNNIIQKGLAFGRDWSGTVVNPERMRAPRSSPAGFMAEVGLRWCGVRPPSTETEDLDVKVCEEAITSASTDGSACRKAVAVSRGQFPSAT